MKPMRNQSPSNKPEPELLRPFYWVAGAEQLIVSNRLNSDLWVKVTSGDYGVLPARSDVGTVLERAAATRVVDALNARWVLDGPFEPSSVDVLELFRAEAAVPVAEAA